MLELSEHLAITSHNPFKDDISGYSQFRRSNHGYVDARYGDGL